VSCSRAAAPAPKGYKQWQDPVKRSSTFDQLTRLMQERIIYIDGAMGTMIQRFKLTEADFRCDNEGVEFWLIGVVCKRK
jgi:hypothetical protein